ncbi:MAG: hypothetical protein BHW18_05975 [Eubacterium sp. 36_13]|nr:MAG: hypothetical protein BHW18_05975 [Eubacterium sp. 36_13]
MRLPSQEQRICLLVFAKQKSESFDEERICLLVFAEQKSESFDEERICLLVFSKENPQEPAQPAKSYRNPTDSHIKIIL